MHFKIYLLIVFIVCLALAACEQVIDVDLNEVSPRYVIEGTVTDTDEPHEVRITQSKNFDEEDDFKGVDNASVIISDDQGNSESLLHINSGIYKGIEEAGKPGRTYTLTVEIDDEVFTASSIMPNPTILDRLHVETISLFGTSLRIPYANFQDPEGIENYYRHVLFVNGEKKNSIFVSSDALYDGKSVERALPYGDEDDSIAEGDTVLVEMHAIDKQAYEYFSSLIETINRSAASPANPTTNISGDVLGYFSAHAVRKKEIILN